MDCDSGPGITDRVPAEPGTHSNPIRGTVEYPPWSCLHQPRDVFGAPPGPSPAPATTDLLNRVATLERQSNELTDPLFWPLKPSSPDMSPTLQDAVNEARSEAHTILSVYGHLVGHPLASHTLREAVRRTQTVLCTLDLMRGSSEHPPTTAPRAERATPPSYGGSPGYSPSYPAASRTQQGKSTPH